MQILSKSYFFTYTNPYNSQSDQGIGLRGQKPLCPLPACVLKDKQIQPKITVLKYCNYYDRNIDLFMCVRVSEEKLCVLHTSTNKTTQQASVIDSV